jgi:hypothetical protein
MTEETLRGSVEFDFEPQPLEQLSVERTCFVSTTCGSGWVVIIACASSHLFCPVHSNENRYSFLESSLQ